MGKLKAIIVGYDKNLNIKVIETEGKTAKIRKHWKPVFEPESIFLSKEISTTPIVGRILTRRHKRMPTAIFVEGRLKAEKFEPRKKSDPVLPPLSSKEIATMVDKEVARARTQFKPISRIEFVVLCLLVGINMVLTFMVLNGVRIR